MDRIGALRARIGELSWVQRGVIAAPFVLAVLMLVGLLRSGQQDVFAQAHSVGRDRLMESAVVVSSTVQMPGVVVVPTTPRGPLTTASSSTSVRYAADSDPSLRASPPVGVAASKAMPATVAPTTVALRFAPGAPASAPVTVAGQPGVTVLDVDARAHGMSAEIHDEVLALAVDVIHATVTGVGRDRFSGFFGGLDADGKRLAQPPVQCLAPEVTHSGLYATKYANYGVVIAAWTCPGLEQEHVSEQLVFFTGSVWKPVHAWDAPADVTAGVMTG